jgi:uncharacterized membrane protein
MELDYYQLYKDQPVPELVKVARTPGDYQPEAVAAAAKILRERGIALEEIADEEWKLAQKEMADALSRQRIGDYTRWIGDLFRPNEWQDHPERWFKALLVLYGIYFIYSFFWCIFWYKVTQ